MKSKVINYIDLYASNINLIATLSANHNNIVDALDRINLSYGESSVSEDMALNGFLSIYNAAKSIVSENTNSLVIESFLSQDYFDVNFPLDKQLNIDIQNGDLTLPIKSTLDVEVSSIIVENDSNGSTLDTEESSIESILNGNSSSLFQYTKISNSFSMSDLCLALTLKTKTDDIANGLYVQLYADDNTEYPNIDMIESSKDGETWTKIPYVSDIKKADHYIRFEPVELRYIRIRFIQSTYSNTQTGFGIRYKYLIGIRQIAVKKTIYDTSGQYASIPFTGKKKISSVMFGSQDTGNVNYYISANNGTKLLKINNGDNMQLYNNELGLRDDTDIESIRLMISMDKSSVSLKSIDAIEYLPSNNIGKYYVKNTPQSIKMYIGKHISYGGMVDYIIDLKDISSINASILDTDDNIYGSVTLNFIPYYDGINSDLTLKLNGTRVKNDRSIYEITKHQDKNHSILQIKNSALVANNATLSISYVKLTSNGQYITLPQRSFFRQKDGFIISSSASGSNDEVQLSYNDFEIADDGLITTIKINDSAYSKSNYYNISYYPLVDTTDYITSTNGPEINTQALHHMIGSQVCFEYKYNDNATNYLSEYYTPICNEYRIELI